MPVGEAKGVLSARKSPNLMDGTFKRETASMIQQ